MKEIIGKKIGMTRVFDKEGNIIPASLVIALPLKVVKILPKSDKGTASVQAEVISTQKNKKIVKKPKIYQLSINQLEQYKKGDEIKIDQFEDSKTVSVVAKGKGKGFSGVIKRHGFSRGPKTHGSDHHRAPGSIGGGYPQRVVLGRRMPGRLGGNQVTIKGLKVLAIDKNSQIIALSGSIPGPNKSDVRIISE